MSSKFISGEVTSFKRKVREIVSNHRKSFIIKTYEHEYVLLGVVLRTNMGTTSDNLKSS